MPGGGPVRIMLSIPGADSMASSLGSEVPWHKCIRSDILAFWMRECVCYSRDVGAVAAQAM